MKKSLIGSVLAIVGLGLLATGCVVEERGAYRPRAAVVVAGPAVGAEVEVGGAPPPAPVETLTVSPAPGFIWIGGAWMWRGGWVWEAGHWSRPPHAGAVWVPHRYVFRNGRHVWVRGYWR